MRQSITDPGRRVRCGRRGDPVRQRARRRIRPRCSSGGPSAGSRWGRSQPTSRSSCPMTAKRYRGGDQPAEPDRVTSELGLTAVTGSIDGPGRRVGDAHRDLCRSPTSFATVDGCEAGDAPRVLPQPTLSGMRFQLRHRAAGRLERPLRLTGLECGRARRRSPASGRTRRPRAALRRRTRPSRGSGRRGAASPSASGVDRVNDGGPLATTGSAFTASSRSAIAWAIRRALLAGRDRARRGRRGR